MQRIDPPAPPSNIPYTITEDRAARLPPSQVASNRRALSGDMYQLILNAVKPYLAGEDLFGVTQALSDIMINRASSTSALIDLLARKLPVLQHVGAEWMHIAVRAIVSVLRLFFFAGKMCRAACVVLCR
jgi:hypothetical protein